MPENTEPRSIFVSFRTIGIACAIILSFVFPALSGSTAWADAGPACGPNYYEEYDHERHCLNNSWYLPLDECHDFCMNSDYCTLYQDNQRTVFGGFWQGAFPSSAFDDLKNRCTEQCTNLKAQCSSNNQECLARFLPQDPDCSQLTNVQENEYCSANCINTILTSECGRNCMKDADKNDICRVLCSENCYDSYCASIPMSYDTKWSIFGVLMTLLAAASLIILVFVHRNNNTQTDSEHS
ncbi:MAG: hypothetical protein IJM59_13215 [Proteobacteria bacterium]|nr:hypothetical protein [Pseudomonadota bacterium]